MTTEVTQMSAEIGIGSAITSDVAKRNLVPANLGNTKTHIGVDGDAKRVIKEVAARHGMKEIAVVSRIYLWFARQNDLVQRGVLGMLPEGYESELLKAAVERQAGKSKGK
jgi:hypothetical protein